LDSLIVQRLDKEFGHVIRETFDIEPVALTADEAQYLVASVPLRKSEVAALKQSKRRISDSARKAFSSLKSPSTASSKDK
jgi:predicted DNA-binding transcriptional regulator YafY